METQFSWSPRKRRIMPGMEAFSANIPPVVSVPDMEKRERAILESGFPHLGPRRPATDQPVFIVGTGLSVKTQVRAIGENRQRFDAKICAVKGACDWLITQGIVPDMAVATDPRQERARIFVLRDPGVKYYLSSIMHTDAWYWMRGLDVTVWHPIIEIEQKLDPNFKDVEFIYGGATTGLRTIPLMHWEGYRNISLFGFDSTVSPEGVMKVTGEHIHPDEKIKRMKMIVGGQKKGYWTTDNLAAQVTQMQGTVRKCPGAMVTAHGDGLFQDYLREGKRMGWQV